MARRETPSFERFQEALGLGEPPWIVGHRGAAGSAPENTLQAVLAGIAEGADMIEIDVQRTADGRFVAAHDRDVRRVAGRRRRIEEATFEELRRLDFGIRFPNAPSPTPIPELGEILDAVPRDVPLNLELKRWTARREEFARALAREVRARGRILISSFDWPLLSAVRAEMPDHPVAPVARRRLGALLEAARRLDAVSVHCHQRFATARFARKAAEEDRPVLVYTVNSAAAAARVRSAGAAGVFTDFPERARRFFSPAFGSKELSRA